MTEACRLLEDAVRIENETAEIRAIQEVDALIHAIENAVTETKPEV